jgi:glycosyltransferase 2 family protein
MLDLKRLLYLLFGLCLGGGLLWILLAEVSVAEVKQALALIDYTVLGYAMACYAIAIALRSLRWKVLLGAIVPAPYRKVLVVLIVGYAVNGLLPARLGEIARADLARSMLKLPRSKALGTIALERAVDGLTVVGLLALGLGALPAGAAYAKTLNYVLLAAAGLFAAVAVILYVLSGRSRGAAEGWLAPVARRFGQFRDGLQILRSPSMAIAILLTVPVWAADSSSVWFVLNAVHVSLQLQPLMMTVGIVSLSTLLPTAPGFIGTYQLAFVIAVTSFGFSKVQGFAAATTSQVFILGTHCVIGIALMLFNHVRLSGLFLRKDVMDTRV